MNYCDHRSYRRHAMIVPNVPIFSHSSQVSGLWQWQKRIQYGIQYAISVFRPWQIQCKYNVKNYFYDKICLHYYWRLFIILLEFQFSSNQYLQ